jgi:cytochrome c-type biogenesis protein CcsB
VNSLTLVIGFDALLAAALLYVAYMAWPGAWLGRVATAVAGLAFLLVTTGFVLRGVAAGHWPLTNRSEFTLLFGWATLGVYLWLERASGERIFGAFVTPLAAGLVSYALVGLAEQTIRPLSPVLRSVWLQVHVLSAAVGYGAGGVAAGLGALFLIQNRRPEENRLPAAAEIDAAMNRAVAVSFPFLSLALLAGAIWAQTAWGRYWGWDPKETWALVTWLVYLVFLHGRALRGWRGRPLAWLALGGLGCILFTFLGIDWLAEATRVESLHVF